MATPNEFRQGAPVKGFGGPGYYGPGEQAKRRDITENRGISTQQKIANTQASLEQARQSLTERLASAQARMDRARLTQDEAQFKAGLADAKQARREARELAEDQMNNELWKSGIEGATGAAGMLAGWKLFG